MIRDAIPDLHEPFGPRCETRQYADSSRRFGAPHARPETGDTLAVGRVENWSASDLHFAATAGAEDPCSLTDIDVTRICLAYLALQRQLEDERDRRAGTETMLEFISAENVTLRHRLAGTTPAAELVATGRSPTLEDLLQEAVERHHPSDEAETVVVDIPIPERTRP